MGQQFKKKSFSIVVLGKKPSHVLSQAQQRLFYVQILYKIKKNVYTIYTCNKIKKK